MSDLTRDQVDAVLAEHDAGSWPAGLPVTRTDVQAEVVYLRQIARDSTRRGNEALAADLDRLLAETDA